MCRETGLTEEMRDSLRNALPPQAFLRRDRGKALFVSNAPAFMKGVPVLPGFVVERRGPLIAILPEEGWARQLEQADCAPDHLAASLKRFRGKATDREGLELLAQGWKLADMAAASDRRTDTYAIAEAEAYEHALRHRAALALRGACSGGGLYAAALINAWLRSYLGKAGDMR